MTNIMHFDDNDDDNIIDISSNNSCSSKQSNKEYLLYVNSKYIGNIYYSDD